MGIYLQHAYSLLNRAIKGVAILSLLFCFFVALIELLLAMATHPRNHSFTQLPEFLAYFFLPVFMMVFIDGMLIGTFLAWWRKKLSGFAAAGLGLTMGICVALASDYMAWLNIGAFERSISFPDFWSFIIRPFSDFFVYAFFANRLFLPIAFSSLVSIYLGWRMNNLHVPSTIEIKE